MTFREKVFQAVRQIPEGKVTYYGYIALLAGKPTAARQVGWALASLYAADAPDRTHKDVPWWRVVNKQGYLSIRGHETEIKNIQRDLLLQEGVEVNLDLHIDMEKYAWTG